MGSRMDGTNPRALAANPRAVAAAEKRPAPGHLTCFNCCAEFDPSKSAIKGRKVAPSMNCNACLKAGYEQGRWQEVFLHNCAAEAKVRAA